MTRFVFLIVLFLVSGILVSQTKSPICQEFDKMPKRNVSGSSTFFWIPGGSENGVAFTGTINWEFDFFGCPALKGSFLSNITGTTAYIDGKAYTANELGVDVFNKLKPYTGASSEGLQKAVLYYDIYVGDKFIKTISVSSHNYLDVNCYESLKTYFTSDEICSLFVSGFSVKISKVENMCFDGLLDARNAVKEYNKTAEYNSKIKNADALFGEKKWEEAKTAYLDALKVKREKYAEDKVAEINQIIQKEQKEKTDREQKEKDVSGKKDNETSSKEGDNPNSKEASNVNIDEEKDSGDEGNSNSSNSNDENNNVNASDAKLNEVHSAENDEENRKKAEMAKAKLVYDQSIERSKQIEAQSKAFGNEVTNTLNTIIANNQAYNRYKSNIADVTKLPESKDPSVLLQAYESQVEEAKRIHEQRRKEEEANIQQYINQKNSQATNQLEQSTNNLAGTILQISNDNAIAKAKAESERKLTKQLEEAFDKIKEEINTSNQTAYDKYMQLASYQFKPEDEKIYLDMADYHLCIIKYTQSHFSYDYSSWIKHNCGKPINTKVQKNDYNPTAEELYQTAMRKSNNLNSSFKKAAIDYINLAIETDPKNAQYYYYKSTLQDDIYLKIASLSKATALDSKHYRAKEDYSFLSAKASLNLEDMKKFVDTYPSSKYRTEALSIKKYLEDLIVLDQLLVNKKIIDANVLHEQIKNHPLYNRAHVKNSKMLDFVEEEVCFKKAIENDIKANKLKVRRTFYSDYISKYPNGMYKDTVNLRLKLLNMRLGGYYLTLSGGLNIGTMRRVGVENFLYTLGYEINNSVVQNRYGYSSREMTKAYDVYGTSIRLSQYNLIYKDQKDKLPRIDMELFAGVNYVAGRKYKLEEGLSTEDDYSNNSDAVSFMNSLDSSTSKFIYYNEYDSVYSSRGYLQFKDKNRVTFMNFGAQIWVGKMFGIYLSYNNLKYSRTIFGEYTIKNSSSTDDRQLVSKLFVVKKVAPGFSFAPINNKRYIFKVSYSQFNYKEDLSTSVNTPPFIQVPSVDFKCRNIEVYGAVRIKSFGAQRIVLGASFNYNSLKNNNYQNVLYDFKQINTNYFQLNIGVRI